MPRGEANRPAVPAFSSGVEIAEVTMALPVEDPKLRREALAYVIRLYDELTRRTARRPSARRTRLSISSWPIPSCAAPSRSGPRPPRAAEGLGSIAAEGDPVIRLWPAISEWRIYHHRAGVAEI
jgi:hypothetical protein